MSSGNTHTHMHPNQSSSADSESAAERKRKRLEAWRKRQQEQSQFQFQSIQPKLSLKLSRKKSRKTKLAIAFDGLSSSEEEKEKGMDVDEFRTSLSNPPPLQNQHEIDDTNHQRNDGDDDSKGNMEYSNNKKDNRMKTTEENNVNAKVGTKRSRWDNKNVHLNGSSLDQGNRRKGQEEEEEEDALDAFMKQSKIIVKDQNSNLELNENESNDVIITEEEEEEARRQLIEALKKQPVPTATIEDNDKEGTNVNASTSESYVASSQIKNAKLDRQRKIERLEAEVKRLRAHKQQNGDNSLDTSETESGVMEESERELSQLLNADNDALNTLAELNKKKELRSVDHSSIDYLDVPKNLYVVPRALASLTKDEVTNLRGKLQIRVRGVGCPAPIQTFDQSGLSERILSILATQNIVTPYPIQAQCLPAVMAGRDVIGIAKTGSGKTLAYLLPMLRHILAQPDLAPFESGPIGLVLAPARELAVQIYSVCKTFCKNMNIKSTAIYGGAGVAEQIGDLKRGCHIVVATPGRMIDVLTMQSGKLLSLNRVSFVVMDEADRMFDMGFAPQITSILSAVRPDRQTVLFSATFPKTVEALARKSLSYPIEVLVGGRSVASDTITQYGECMEEGDKFLRLLQLLGDHIYDDDSHGADENDEYTNSKKCIIFVDTQLRADALFEQLIRSGYLSCQSLHGGKEQEDRDNTISDFKRHNGPNLLVATSVAGRGLDVPSVVCVINYSAPSHLEDYVHRVGRTGRAGRKGVAYTFVNIGDEAKFAPIVCRAMTEAGQAEHISEELKQLSESFKEKVKKGEAKWAGSGFKGKGYSYDASELSDAQKLAKFEKRQALIEAGMLDEDDDQAISGSDRQDQDIEPVSSTEKSKSTSADVKMTAGMQDAIMRKLGLATAIDIHGTGNHFVEDMDINDFPREARWKVTQKETISRMQDDYGVAITLKGEYLPPGREPKVGEERLHLHLQAQTHPNLMNCVHEIKRLLNEETLRVGARNPGSSSSGGRYNVM